uniref:Peptidase M48, Ste24p n=1 Tax=Solibacter usitatus (strain Ellin6076) TaxID=234267 RepID=Q01WK6_SOLUE
MAGRRHDQGMSMLRHAWILVLPVAGLFAQDTSPARGVNFYSIEKEQALGVQLAKEYRRNVTVIEDATVKTYLDDLGQRLAAKAQGPAFTYCFELVSDGGIVLNEPVAFPGGLVFVPTSLIRAAKSEDELAGMLAHAIEHIAARHGTKQATREEIVNQATIPLIYMGGWSGNAIRQGTELALPLGFLKFHRQAELQADTLAVPTMAAAGHDPRALVNYMERALPADAAPPSAMSALPGREVRLNALRKAVESVPANTYPPHDGFAAIQQAVARLDVKPAKVPPRLAPHMAPHLAR